MFHSIEDANMRLRKSVVRVEGVPVFVHECDTRSKIRYTPLKRGGGFQDGEGKVDSLFGTEVDISAFPLGYVANEECCTYIQRIPRRRFKQGLNAENCKTYGPFDFDRLLNSFDFVQMVEQSYLPFKDALKMVTEGEMLSCPFNLKWCVAGYEDDTLLFYKNQKVGEVKEGNPFLHKEFRYLKESLEEAVR